MFYRIPSGRHIFARHSLCECDALSPLCFSFFICHSTLAALSPIPKRHLHSKGPIHFRFTIRNMMNTTKALSSFPLWKPVLLHLFPIQNKKLCPFRCCFYCCRVNKTKQSIRLPPPQKNIKRSVMEMFVEILNASVKCTWKCQRKIGSSQIIHHHTGAYWLILFNAMFAIVRYFRISRCPSQMHIACYNPDHIWALYQISVCLTLHILQYLYP